MSLYTVHFKWKGKVFELNARVLDLTHPYFVSIAELTFPSNDSPIIDPTKDETKRTFGNVDNLMIPVQAVAMIEQRNDKNTKESARQNLSIFHHLPRRDDN